MDSIQNPQTSKNQLLKTQKTHTFSLWAQKYFQQNCSLCIKENKSVFICADNSCTISNPFICGKQQCGCIKSHEQCNIRFISPLLKEIEKKQSPAEQLEETIQSTMDQIIDVISTSKQHMLKLLREGMVNSVVEDVEEMRQNNIKRLFQQDLKGSVLAQLINYNNECNSEQRRFHAFKVQTAQIFRNFKQNKLNPFLSEVIEKFFNQNNYFFWEANLRQPFMSVVKTKIIDKSTDRKQKLCLLSPGISKLYGLIFRWRIKIIKITKEDCWISLGIALKQEISKRNFIFSERQNYSCYMITNNGKTYSAFDPIKDNQTVYGFEFYTNDIIQLQLDTRQWIIRFKNQRTSKSTELKIQKIPQPQQDDYHICIGSNTKDTQVEIISPIETQVANYQICG